MEVCVEHEDTEGQHVCRVCVAEGPMVLIVIASTEFLQDAVDLLGLCGELHVVE